MIEAAEELGKRVGKFGLELPAEKTRVIPFLRHTPAGRSGFEFYWGKDRGGRPHLKRCASRKKLRASLRRSTEWCKENRNLKPGVLFKRLNAKLRGYYNYYGVIGNYASLKQFYHQAMRILFKWLNRSQRRSYTSNVRCDGYSACNTADGALYQSVSAAPSASCCTAASLSQCELRSAGYCGSPGNIRDDH
jgi:hypothetical protein